MEPLKERSKMDPAFMWDLTKMYAADEDWERDLEALKGEAEKVASFRGSLHTPENVKNYLDYETELERKVELLDCYAALRFTEDTRQEKAKSMQARAMNLYVALMTAGAYAEPELLSLEQELLEEITESPLTEEYRVLLRRLADRKKHTLTTAEETIIASFGEVLAAPGETAHSLEDSDMVFGNVKDGEGKERELSGSNFVFLESQEDRVLRKNAFETYYAGFRGHINTFASTMQANVKREAVTASLRHYASSREMMTGAERVPVKVYDNLIEAVRRHLPDMYRYVRLRRKLLGVDSLHFYDIYAPLVKGSQKIYSFDEAKEMLYEAVAPLGEDYVNAVREGCSRGWIDVYPNKGKRGGAFSSGCYDSEPYIMLNYTGTLDSVSTLVHEMGHSMHSYLSRRNQPPQYAHYTLFVAEVASTVNENLLVEHLLEQTEDPAERLSLLNQYLENFKGTVYRQTMFAEFEKQIHELSEQGEALTPQALCGVYGKLVEDYFGPDMVIDDEIRYEWARIPHFYTPFYVYKYATSYSAAVALSEGIRAEAQGRARGNVKNYLEFLSMGCSKDPLEELQHAGVDLSTAAPIDAALDKFASVLDEAEKIAEKL